MKRKPKRVTVGGTEFDLLKIGEKSRAVYEILHVESGRSLRVQFTKRSEAESFLTRNAARITYQVASTIHQLRNRRLTNEND